MGAYILYFMDVVEDPLVTLPEAAKSLPISLSYLYQLVSEGKIPVVHLGDRLLIKRSVVSTLRTDGTDPYIGVRKAEPILEMKA
jgi:excisionase family DNA binding protein